MRTFKFKSSFIIIFLLLAIGLGVKAQKPLSQQFIDSAGVSINGSDVCGTDILLGQLRRNPDYKIKEDQMNREILGALNTLTDDTLTLPVVIHIINQNPYAITNTQVINGIKTLNDAFSKSGAYAASAGADTKLRFCIAKKDPDGGITTGITRTTSYFSNSLNKDIEDSRLKNLIQWDPSKYINIWLITSIESEAYANFSCGAWYRLRTGGYATLPPGGGALDGIVITAFGNVLAHEMGHYLGLYHTFEGGCSNYNCLTSGDRVCDTPPDNSVKPSCGSPENSCNTDTLSNYSNGSFFTDVPDQVTNFMDYGNGSCSNQFTKGQADRMRAAIITQRPGLLLNECDPPCTENIVASFTRDIAYSVLGNTIHFTNTSSGGTNFEWLVNDSVISTAINFSYTFNTATKDKITLKVFNIPGCFASYTSYVITGCGVTARFYSNKQVIASKANIYSDSIFFTNTSYNGLTYQWLMSNDKGMAEQVISTGLHFKYVFPVPANYRLRLIATNGTCSDTTSYYSIPVIEPTADASLFGFSFTCYGSNKVTVNFCIANYGYAPIPKGTPVSFYDADPRIPGATKLSSTMYLPYAVPGGNCYLCFSHVLTVSYKGLEKIYISINDSGLVLPVVFPNTNLVETNYFNNITWSQTKRTTIYRTICDGTAYAGYKTAGTYIDTLVSKLSGCDSIRTLYLTVNPVFKTTITTAICAGQNYAGHVASGTYVDHFIAANGCDSTRTLYLTVKPNRSTTINGVICEGQNFEGYNKSGKYIDHFKASNGCDSTRTLFLTVKPKSYTEINASICAGKSYWAGGGWKVSPGTYFDTLINYLGCDSIITTKLQVILTVKTTIYATICDGNTFAGYNSAGTYIDTLVSKLSGCDSIRTLYLTVNPVFKTTITTSICDGQNYGGHTASGTYTDHFISAKGCDSTRTLYLTVKPNRSKTINAVICEGQSFEGYIKSGKFIDVFTASNGCDSTRTLNLTVKPRSYTNINATICEGDTHWTDGGWKVSPGTYYDTLINYLGCDSVITTNLRVNPLPKPELGNDRGVCIGDFLKLDPGAFTTYLWQDGSTNSTFSTNKIGHYSVKVTNQFGCIASAKMNVTRIDPLPKNFLRTDTSLCRGNIVVLEAPGFTTYSWNTGESNASINVTKNGLYQLNATDKNGCKGTDSVKISFYDCQDVWIPNAFTPDKNRLNELFRPIFPAPVKNYRFQIWNRSGLRVFESYNTTQGWDGKFKGTDQPVDVYVYVITFEDVDGKSIIKKGTISLLR